MTRSSGKRSALRIAAVVAAAILLAASLFFTFGRSAGLDVPDYGDVFRLFGLSPQSDSAVSFLEVASVGNADCVIIYSNGHAAVIDGGDDADAGHAVEKALRADGIRSIDCVFATHFHDDHIGGIPRILDVFDVRRIVLPPDGASYGARAELERAIERAGTPTAAMAAGDVFRVGDFTLTVLCVYADEPDENDRSAVIMAECGGVRFLLTGDAGKSAEKRLIDSGADLKADVLKIGHHGSGTATTDRFLGAVSPDHAVISCGVSRASIPAGGVIEKLHSAGVEVLRTDISGSVRFNIENGGIRIETER